MDTAIKRKPISGSSWAAYPRIASASSNKHPTEEGAFTTHQRPVSSASATSRPETQNDGEPFFAVPGSDSSLVEHLSVSDFALKPTASPVDVRKYVKWSVHRQESSYVVVCFLISIALALGQHFYYQSLDGSSAGSTSRQQWALTFGTSFSYLTVHLLAAATLVAYSQYI
jgi:hypothetical protein